MSDHAKLSPSASGRWLECAGSVTIIEFLKRLGHRESSGAAALEGTVAHRALELVLKSKKVELDVLEAITRAIEEEKGAADIEIDLQEMKRHVYEAVRFIRSQAQEDRGYGILTETKLEHPHFKDIWGTADVVFKRVAPDGVDELVVFDFKYGRVPVDAAGNPQVLIYLDMARSYLQADRFVGIVYQPRKLSGDPVTETVLTTEEMDDWSSEVLRPGVEKVRAAAKTVDVIDYLVPTAKGCRYCPAAYMCPVARAALDATATIPFPDSLSVHLTAARIAVGVAKNVEATAMDAAKAGKPVPGFRLTNGCGRRVYKDGADTAAALELGDAAFKTTLLSPNELSKVTIYGKEAVDFVKKHAYMRPGEQKLTECKLDEPNDPKVGKKGDLASIFSNVKPQT